GRSIGDLTQRNVEGAKRWKELTSDQQLFYHKKAKELPLGSSLNKWKESRRILENLKSSCVWAEKFGVHLCYILVHKDDPYVGGTATGQEWLNCNPYLPLSFACSVDKSITPMPAAPRNKQCLVKEVETLLNNRY
uniref:Uncharacterized protein n=1 Tax=Amphimedon queenslandica TaxID=400682 RepID=A0A1X7T1L9_AMPQE